MLKSFIHNFFVIAILATSFSSPIFAKVDYQIEAQPQVIEKVVEFEQKRNFKAKSKWLSLPRVT